MAFVIYLLYGADTYRARQTFRRIRDELAAESGDMLASNTTTLDGRSLTPGELLAHATAMPFLAPARLVVVERLLATIGEIRAGRRSKKTAADDPLEPGRRAAATLSDPASMPETTTLVFMEEQIERTNSAFPIFAPIARTIEHAPLSKEDLPAWIDDRAREKGVKLAPRAMASLTQLVGPELWTIENELDKLAAYAQGETVEPETVALLVSAAQEGRIWDLTDAIEAGDERKALRAMRLLLGEGEASQRILVMIVRQFRQLTLVKDLRERGVRPDEVARASGVPNFRLGAVGAIASRFAWPALRAAYGRILEADLSVKRGLMDDGSALQLLVHDLCAMAPAGAARR
jgi:DNA polymerase-3 subunit delta